MKDGLKKEKLSDQLSQITTYKYYTTLQRERDTKAEKENIRIKSS